MTTWQPGAVAWFEYHCAEDDESADARLWHHSHQQVTVTGRLQTDPAAAGLDEAGRAEAGLTGTYVIQFADGYAGSAFEDELLSDPAGYFRPDPPG
jgi:hypothetical protein